ncbi:MAG UNVERIFIED_CONTAM: hypothetical protein LVT10_26070 [Anaerolineae bacterium]
MVHGAARRFTPRCRESFFGRGGASAERANGWGGIRGCYGARSTLSVAYRMVHTLTRSPYHGLWVVGLLGTNAYFITYTTEIRPYPLVIASASVSVLDVLAFPPQAHPTPCGVLWRITGIDGLCALLLGVFVVGTGVPLRANAPFAPCLASLWVGIAGGWGDLRPVARGVRPPSGNLASAFG